MNKKHLLATFSLVFIAAYSPFSVSEESWNLGQDSDRRDYEEKRRSTSPLIRSNGQNKEEGLISNNGGYGQRALQQNATNFTEIQNIHNSTMQTFRQERTKIQNNLNKLKVDIAPLEKEAKQDYWENFGSKFGSWFGTTPREETAARAKASQLTLDRINSDIDKAASNLQFNSDLIEKQEREFLEQAKIKKNKDEKVLDEIQILRNHIQRSDALREFSKLKIEALTDQDKLDIIEKEVDKSTIGNYIQVKLGKFMNSKSFCSAAEQCSGRNRKENANVSQKDFTNEIFGNRTIGPNDQNINENTTK